MSPTISCLWLTKLNTEACQVLGAHGSISIEPMVFVLLLCLIDNRKRAVSRDELLDVVWKRYLSRAAKRACRGTPGPGYCLTVFFFATFLATGFLAAVFLAVAFFLAVVVVTFRGAVFFRLDCVLFFAVGLFFTTGRF